MQRQAKTSIERTDAMKATPLLILLASVMILWVTPTTSLAGAGDTVVVAALPPGNLNEVINADTTSGGFTKPNRVYLLKQNSGLDTVYYMTAPIVVKGNVRIVGYINPVTGHPPVVAPFIAIDNSSIGYFFGPQGNDTLLLKGLYFLGTRTDTLSFTGRFVSPTGDNNVFFFDHCILENISGSGNPNLFDTWNHDHNSFFVTNCEFRNNQDDAPQNPGFAWVDPGTYPCDTAYFRNNTFFMTGGEILGSAGYGCSYVDFQHNTIFLSGGGGSFDLYQIHHATIQNNIFYGVSSASVPTSWTSLGNWGSGAIIIDSLTTLKADPYNMAEADRHVVISHNVYFWPQQIYDCWAQLNAGVMASDPMFPQTFISTQPGILTDKITWPNIVVSNNDSTDPGFNSTLVATAAGKMATYADTAWHHGGAGQGVRPYVYSLYNPPSLTSAWPNVSSTWAATQGYPVPENLRYSNTSLQSAGTDGKALGDLNWFPEQLATSVAQNREAVPGQFELSQNYPNPFNPTTRIAYTLSQSSNVELVVFNTLGQMVTTLVNGTMPAGQHFATFDAHNLASGVYFYRLTAGENVSTMKMVLMK